MYLVIPIVFLTQTPDWSWLSLRAAAGSIAQAWLAWTAIVVAGRVVYLWAARGARLATVWFVKLATDPLTDLVAYTPRHLGMARLLLAAGGRRGRSH